ncbi:hypothetical protein RHSIM_Rhsim03G0017600 [Rhododendron simsii]|uniref:Uncharacterized protein n=1 Tax=Rhododendron simsii TaxID=118357 RepID=A0A834HC10_RHOSS|nr:hypothetical protein RHSIM_Rhsim03G0017600 [Rhododendron simsii]
MADEGDYSDGWDEAPPATFKPKEITAIMNDFAEPGTLAPTGLYLGGTKYTVIDPRRSRGCHKRKEVIMRPFELMKHSDTISFMICSHTKKAFSNVSTLNRLVGVWFSARVVIATVTWFRVCRVESMPVCVLFAGI